MLANAAGDVVLVVRRGCCRLANLESAARFGKCRNGRQSCGKWTASGAWDVYWLSG